MFDMDGADETLAVDSVQSHSHPIFCLEWLQVVTIISISRVEKNEIRQQMVPCGSQ
jgi:GTPase